LIGLGLGAAGVLADLPEFALGLAIPFVWLFLEALLLSTWGTTPGKWLFKTWVADAMGNRLSFMDALSRSFSVWFMGLGFGLPIVSPTSRIRGLEPPWRGRNQRFGPEVSTTSTPPFELVWP